jgi:hypothetical protein
LFVRTRVLSSEDMTMYSADWVVMQRGAWCVR